MPFYFIVWESITFLYNFKGCHMMAKVAYDYLWRNLEVEGIN